MGINKSFKTAEKKYAIGIYGLLISVISLGAGYYWAVQERKPELIFDILSNTQVFSVNEEVSELKIIYNNEDLKSKNKKLTLLTVRIENSGNEDITENDYYSESLFGFKLSNADLAEAPVLIDASNEFLLENIKVNSDSINQIYINKVPIDKSESFTIKILAIVANKSVPKISPIGYISGTSGDIRVIESYKSSAKKAPPITTSDKILRIFGIIFLILIGFILLKIIYEIYWGRKKTNLNPKLRKLVVKKVKEKLGPEKLNFQNEIFEMIFSLYIKYGNIYFHNYPIRNIIDLNFLDLVIRKREKNEDIDTLFKFKDGQIIKSIVMKILDQNLVEKGQNGIDINTEFLKFKKRFEGISIIISDVENDYY
ncbi:hypothetical protein [Christiangramia echinicola]|uniref:Uncharacterized protein n=1 Tax=Christiangramia echinicola TaxID=279359 RepID=A0A1H1KW10_9FLAO|nr:hypothetical protein [Christiangramia echinicola]SDR66220.1 hypothetical protein SAMN04488552_0257 [Christiangramia echinicola]